MLIGSAFEAGTETTENVLNPKTGESIVLSCPKPRTPRSTGPSPAPRKPS